MTKHEFRVVVAAVIKDENGKILLGKRHPKDDNLPDFWSIPAGHAEAEEHGLDTLEETLIREVKEEIGVEIEVFDYLDSHVWVADDYKKITIVFLGKIVKGTPKPHDETIEVGWFDIEEIKQMELPPNVMRVLTKAINIGIINPN
ncbi:NUDIX hydrolase [Nanoarchaeota archaeon]